MTIPTGKNPNDAFAYLLSSSDENAELMRTAVLSDFQVGLPEKPSELQLTGRISYSSAFVEAQPSQTIYFPPDATIFLVSILPFEILRTGVAYSELEDLKQTITVILPQDPRIGQVCYIKDASGTADVCGIKIQGSKIDGSDSKLLDYKDGCIGFVWTGASWSTLSDGNQLSSDKVLSKTIQDEIESYGTATTDPAYIVLSSSPSLPNERVLTAGSNITIIDGGPGGSITISSAGGGGGGSGDVVGPASATDNAVARFNLTTGKLIQNSGVIIDDSDNVTTAGNVAVNGGNVTTTSSTFALANTASTINIGTTAVTRAVNIGTGTSGVTVVPQTVTLGSKHNSSTTLIQGGTGDVTLDADDTIVTGDLAVNGGDLNTAAATFNLINSTATTLNVGGAALLLNVGTDSLDSRIISIGPSIDAGSTDTTAINNTVNVGNTPSNAASSTTVNIGTAGAGNTVNTVSIGNYLTSPASITTIYGDQVNFPQGLSGSLTRLTDGTSYIRAGTNVTVTSASNGAVTISSTVDVDSFFTSTTAGSIFTTGSVAIRGSESSVDAPSDKGTNVFFYVSGSISGSGANDKRALFGGDVVISGSLRQGNFNDAKGIYSHAEGFQNTASGNSSHAEGAYSVASGDYSHAEGTSTSAIASYSHAEGYYTTATGQFSHAEGNSTIAAGLGSHAEGDLTTAAANYSHAEGSQTIASASYSLAAGIGTITSGSGQAAFGKYNKRNNSTSLFIIGDGTGNSDATRGDILRANPGSSIGRGLIEVTGSLAATLGLSGSLTKLVDGTSYLIAGSNVTISSASNGAVTISSTGGSTSPGGSDTQVQFNDGGSTFGGDTGLTFNKTTDTLTIAGDLNVNGGDLNTSTSTFNLIQSASVINFGTTNLARTINIGSDPAGTATTQQVVNIGSKNTSGFNRIYIGDGDSSSGHEVYIVSDNGTQTGTGPSVVELGTVANDTRIDIGKNSLGVKTVTIGGIASTSTTSIRAGSGNITLSGSGGQTVITGSSTTYTDALIGAWEIGSLPATQGSFPNVYAFIGHKDLNHAVDGNYALVQSNTGDTFLGAVSGRDIFFKNGTDVIGQLDNSTVSFTGKTGTATTTTLGNTQTTSTTTIQAGTSGGSLLLSGTNISMTGSVGINLAGRPANSMLHVRQTSDPTFVSTTVTHNGSAFRIEDDDGDAWILSVGNNNNFWWSWTTTASSTTSTGQGYLDASNNAFTLMNFTGQHRCTPESKDVNDYINKSGLIVIATGDYLNPVSGSTTGSYNRNIGINDATPTVKLSDQRNDKRVFGIVSDAEDVSDGIREFSVGKFVSVTESGGAEDNRLFINSIGEGAIWVCNINGSLENGDYITTCEIPGYGMKQDDDLLHNYTVAKITCDCDFTLDNGFYQCEEFLHEGITYRRAFVGCTYHCG